MRYFFGRQIPGQIRILLVESGSRHVLERALPGIEQVFGAGVQPDLLTCYPDPPGWPERFTPRIYKTAEYQGLAGRRRLYRLLRQEGYTVVGLVCSNEPIMTGWKWAVAWQLPAKALIINENADFFWFEAANSGIIWSLASSRAGFSGSGILRLLVRALTFPFVLIYLLGFALFVHIRRALNS